MAIRMDLVKKGRRERRAYLLQQLRKLVDLAKEEGVAGALETRANWTPEETAEGEEIHAALDTQVAAQAVAKDESKAGTLTQAEAFSEGKKLKRRLDRNVRRLFRKGGALPVTQDAFEVGHAIGDSVPKLSAYFGRVLGQLEKVNEPLGKLMKADPVALVREAKTNLDQADSAQERARENVPQETLQVYELMGRAMVFIADLIDAGHEAFDGEAEMAARFNKDILLRGRTSKKEAPEEEKAA